MGRLENFIPKLESFKVEEGGGIAIIQFHNADAFPVDPETAIFLRQVNGHQSLQEIFLFLNNKDIYFSIDKSIDMLRHLANSGMMKNSEDFFQVVNGADPGRSHRPKTNEMDESYFSRERLVALIQKTTLFMKCERSVAENIIDEAKLQLVKGGVRLIQEGSKSKDFFVVLTGQVGVYRQANHLASLGPLSVFGESAAIFDKVRNADVVADDDCWVLRIDASKIVDTSSPETFDSYKGLKSRLILNQTLSANPIFRSLPTDVMQLFISKCRIEKYGREQMVVEQGETTGDFYFILQGSVAIVRDGMPVTSLAEGNHFGEIAAIFREPRTASVLTETQCTFLALKQSSLMEVLASHFRLAIDIEKTAKLRKQSKGNVLQIFDELEEDYSDDNTQIVSLDDLSNSHITIDEELLEISSANFELELVDFSDYSGDPDEEAS